MTKDNAIQYNGVGAIWVGLFLIAAGVLVAAYRLNVGVPGWVVSWPMALTAVGFLQGIYCRFKPGIWLVPFLWGAWWLAITQVTWVDLSKYTTAVAFIITGILFITIKYRLSHPGEISYKQLDNSFVDVTCFWGNAKREVLSQNFAGADAVCVMGNVVVDLSKADIQHSAHIDVTVVLGSAKIIIPASWSIYDDVTTFFGDLNYQNSAAAVKTADGKVVTFDGTAVLGGIKVISCGPVGFDGLTQKTIINKPA